jgi:pyrimidine-specific ribonucleoside hydrolase
MNKRCKINIRPAVNETPVENVPSGKKGPVMKKILGSLALLLLLQPLQCHYKARYHVIIDTDGGVDDFRAICMMLASPEFEVLAITTVDGVLPPEVTAGKVYSLLQQFGHQGIRIGQGTANPEKLPAKTNTVMAGTTIARQLAWGRTDKPMPEGFPPGAVSLILGSIDSEDLPVDIVALGPMTNLAAVLREDPGVPGRVRQVYWSSPEGDKKAFNCAADPGSAREVLASGFSIRQVDARGASLGSYEDFSRGLDTISTRYGIAVRDFYHTAPAGFRDHYMATHPGDDCVPLFMLYPDSLAGTVMADHPFNAARLILGVLDSDREDRCIIFSRFPTDPGLFEEDVAAIAGQVIKKHGLKEWKIVVLTNEFHEHLGAYSIIGAKMGLRAREYFHVGIDELMVTSDAGNQPPLSCLNDGLQVSTGATLGHGTIRLTPEKDLPWDTFTPAARFYFKGRTIQVSLRQEIRDRIREDVSQGVRTYGFETPEYWEYIRELALKYWLELSRFDIFEIAELPSGHSG